MRSVQESIRCARVRSVQESIRCARLRSVQESVRCARKLNWQKEKNQMRTEWSDDSRGVTFRKLSDNDNNDKKYQQERMRV